MDLYHKPPLQHQQQQQDQNLALVATGGCPPPEQRRDSLNPGCPLDLGLVVSGRPVTFDFQQPDPNGLLLEIPRPLEIAQFTLFLRQQLPSFDMGAVVYWAVAPFQDWQFLGVLTNNRPSDIFQTGWSMNPLVQDQAAVRVGVRLENAAQCHEKLSQAPPLDLKMQYAQKVALNLFRYIESFAESGPGQMLQCPQNVLERWLSRFEQKYRLDPWFVLKTE